MSRRNSGVVLAIMVVALVGTPIVSQAAPIVSISPSSSSALVGNSLSVDIAIDGISDLYAFQFDLAFDPAVLRADDVLEGAFLGGGGTTFFISGFIDNTLGIVSFTANSLIGAVPGVTGNGPLATLAFTALGIGTSAVTISNLVLLDSSLADIVDFSTNDGDVTVRRPDQAPEPAAFSFIAIGALLFYSWNRAKAATK